MSVGERTGGSKPGWRPGDGQDPQDGKGKGKKEPKSGANQLVELVVIVAVALALAFIIQAVIVKPYRIPSKSMVPTLQVGQRVLVDRIGTHFRDPKVGDITVFHPPVGAPSQQCGARLVTGQVCTKATAGELKHTNFIKRIVAGPGDTIAIRGGRVIRNGRLAKEPFIEDCGGDGGCDFTRPFKVPSGYYFMMGDNRGSSDDSRYWGPVPKKWIVGPAFFTYWPPKRIGFP